MGVARRPLIWMNRYEGRSLVVGTLEDGFVIAWWSFRWDELDSERDGGLVIVIEV